MVHSENKKTKLSLVCYTFAKLKSAFYVNICTYRARLMKMRITVHQIKRKLVVLIHKNGLHWHSFDTHVFDIIRSFRMHMICICPTTPPSHSIYTPKSIFAYQYNTFLFGVLFICTFMSGLTYSVHISPFKKGTTPVPVTAFVPFVLVFHNHYFQSALSRSF